ncbi:MAG: hypothetical protein QOD67_1848 [Caballeronia sp.]|jgi:hypothetical protein|nr:hypothetical protein [Caballeronia sp.]
MSSVTAQISDTLAWSLTPALFMQARARARGLQPDAQSREKR